MRSAFIESLIQLAKKDERVCLLTGDLGFTVLEKFADAFPGRFFNVGVAEANMIGLATGLALEGWIPYVYSIATFASMRGYEQIRNGPVLHQLPVRIIGIGGGFAYGHSGITHYALEDIAIMRTQPGITVISPADPPQTRSAILSTYDLKGPVYYRIGKGGNVVVPGLDGRFALDLIPTLGRGQELLVLTTGSIAADIAEITTTLASTTLGIVAALNPPPYKPLQDLIKAFPRVLTIEEHYAVGGLGSLVAESIAFSNHRVAFKTLGVPSLPLGVTGTQRFMCELAGLGSTGIKSQIQSLLNQG
jgi:transketolase